MATEVLPATVCLGKLGTPIMTGLLRASESNSAACFNHYIACVRSVGSEERLTTLFPDQIEAGRVTISRNDSTDAVQSASIVILGVNPVNVEATPRHTGLALALQGKLLISVAAGWSRHKIETVVAPYSSSALRAETRI